MLIGPFRFRVSSQMNMTGENIVKRTYPEVTKELLKEDIQAKSNKMSKIKISAMRINANF